MAKRIELLQAWIIEQVQSLKGPGVIPSALQAISGDASFRRYFRFQADGENLIAVDAPPDTENNPAFVAIAEALLHGGVFVPAVHAVDIDRGFLLLSDLGDRQLLGLLTSDNADHFYRKAIDSLISMQKLQRANLNRSEESWTFSCPDYDLKRLQDEMRLFSDWFLPRYLELRLDQAEQQTLHHTFELLAASALAQPQVFVHRDYHSRNIMVSEQDELAIIDFQDGVIGPITYDLVSLLRDCYVSWPKQQVQRWLGQYVSAARQFGLFAEADLSEEQISKWFDWMGVQRHLKAIGIFARLKIRDNKPGYLKDIPRTFNYMLQVSQRYPELAAFHQLLIARVLPQLLKINPEAAAFIDGGFAS